MRRNRCTRSARMIAGLVIGLFFASVAAPLIAQTRSEVRLYDLEREVTLSGTVVRVLTSPSPGMAWGPHLLIDTVSGTVDACLGRWGLQGKGAFSASVGQRVDVTGAMTTFNSRQVFLARVVKADGKVYTLRNERGIPVSPQARERSVQKGEPR